MMVQDHTSSLKALEGVDATTRRLAKRLARRSNSLTKRGLLQERSQT